MNLKLLILEIFPCRAAFSGLFVFEITEVKGSMNGLAKSRQLDGLSALGYARNPRYP
jgi:hypothetical protein